MPGKLLVVLISKCFTVYCSATVHNLSQVEVFTESDYITQVEAYPADVTFRWFFNSSEASEWRSEGDFTYTGLSSQLEFIPRTSRDYGSLYCVAENNIGRQEQPCVFQIVPTGTRILLSPIAIFHIFYFLLLFFFSFSFFHFFSSLPSYFAFFLLSPLSSCSLAFFPSSLSFLIIMSLALTIPLLQGSPQPWLDVRLWTRPWRPSRWSVRRGLMGDFQVCSDLVG